MIIFVLQTKENNVNMFSLIGDTYREMILTDVANLIVNNTEDWDMGLKGTVSRDFRPFYFGFKDST